MTKDYFRSTSHRCETSLVQILQKQNRMDPMEHLKTVGAERKKEESYQMYKLQESTPQQVDMQSDFCNLNNQKVLYVYSL